MLGAVVLLRDGLGGEDGLVEVDDPVVLFFELLDSLLYLQPPLFILI